MFSFRAVGRPEPNQVVDASSRIHWFFFFHFVTMFPLFSKCSCYDVRDQCERDGTVGVCGLAAQPISHFQRGGRSGTPTPPPPPPPNAFHFHFSKTHRSVASSLVPFSLSLSLSLSLFFLFLILFHRILFLLLAAVWLMLLASAGYLSAFFFRKREPTSTSPLPTLNSPLFSVTQVKRFVFSRRRLRHSFHFS